MPSDNVQIVAQAGLVLTDSDIASRIRDHDRVADTRSALEPFVEPDFEVEMIGPDYLPRSLTGRGFDGFRAIWLDWTDAFETYRIEIEDVIDAGDRVVTFARQVGRTKTGGVEVSTPAAAVWTIRESKISRIEFHLDRDAALRSAGLAEGP